jgi:hypothetical protein
MIQIPASRLDFLGEAFDPEGPMSIDNPEDGWKISDLGFDDYCERSGIDGVSDLIMGQLGRLGTNAALDIAAGANARALQDLLERGAIDKALATNYADNRSDETKAIGALTHQTGDLLDRTTWQGIIDWQAAEAPEGLSLVLHRPYGALQYLQPTNAYLGAARLLLDTLRPGGVLFSQIPIALKSAAWPGTPAERVARSIRQRPDIGSMTASDYPMSLFSSVVIVKN